MLADSARFADNHLVAAACSAVALAVAAGSAALLAAAGPSCLAIAVVETVDHLACH